jgi:hypothetical protein
MLESAELLSGSSSGRCFIQTIAMGHQGQVVTLPQVAGWGGRVVRSLMSAIAAHSRAARIAATAESLSLYVPDTASTFPFGESSLNSKPPRLVGISSNVPVMVYIVLRLGARLGQAGPARRCFRDAILSARRKA